MSKRKVDLDRHKIIYALSVQMAPGQAFKWTNPKSLITFEWTAPDDGAVLFYVGETSMTLQERKSKHKTFAKKLVQDLSGEQVIDPHHYPVYYFTTEFCGENGQGFEAHLLQDGPGLTEAEWVAEARTTGHPLQNAASPSKSTKVGGRADDNTWQGAFRRVNEAHATPKVKVEPTEESVKAERERWIAERKAREAQS